MLLPTPWLEPLLLVLLLTPVIVPVLPVPFPALVPDLVLLGTFLCACSCPCVVCTLVGPVPVPRLFVTPPFTWAALVLLVPLPAPLLAPVQSGLQVVPLLTLELVAHLPLPVFTFGLRILLLVALLCVGLPVLVPHCCCCLVYLPQPTYSCYDTPICHPGGRPSGPCGPTPAPFTTPTAIRDMFGGGPG